MKKALEKDGLDYIPVISFNTQGLEKNPGFKVTIPMWEKLAAVILYGDMLMALRNQCRVYEVHKGETDACVQSWIEKLNEQFSNNKGYGIQSLKRNMRQIAHDFASIERDGKKRVKVGVVGEIYVKFSPLGNNHLEDFLYEQGAEVNLPGLLGFAFYCIYNSIMDYELYGGNKAKYRGAKAIMNLVLRFEDIMIDAIKREPSLTAPNSFRHTIQINEEEQGIILNSPKEVIREAFNLGIIDNSDNVWFKMLEGRNIGAHQYDDNTPVLLLDVIADKYSNVLYNLEDFFRNSSEL